MKTSKIIPLVLFTLTIMLVTAGCSAPIEPQAPQVDEPEVVEDANKEPENIEYYSEELGRDMIVTPACQEKCLDDWADVNFSEGFSLHVCHLTCETQLEIDRENQ